MILFCVIQKQIQHLENNIYLFSYTYALDNVFIHTFLSYVPSPIESLHFEKFIFEP